MITGDYGEIFFQIKGDMKGVCFDTCIWISKIFREENHSNPVRRRLGQITKHIFENYPQKGEEYLIIIDTIFWEFRQVISTKVRDYGNKIVTSLIEANNRIKSGEKRYDVVREYRNLIIEDSSINLLYSHFEAKGMGFDRLLDENTRIMFFKKLTKIPLKFNRLFQKITRGFLKRSVKERVVMWTTLNKKSFRQFQKCSPQIGRFDRFHVLGCILLCIIENRNIKFITYDELMLKQSNNYEKFFINNRLAFEKQIEKILEVEAV